MRMATGGMCSKESGIDSNRTFMRTCPFARNNPRGLPLGVIHALGGLHKIRRLRIRNVDEGLRVAVGEREPRTLNLHHDAVPAPESVVDVLHREADLLNLAGSEGLWLFETVAKLSP